MEIELKESQKVKVEAGDIIEWDNNGDKIIFMVAFVTPTDGICAIALTDNRGYTCPHSVNFESYDSLKLIMKASEIGDKFNKLKLDEE